MSNKIELDLEDFTAEECKTMKNIFIKHQMYQLAASARDTEKRKLGIVENKDEKWF